MPSRVGLALGQLKVVRVIDRKPMQACERQDRWLLRHAVDRYAQAQQMPAEYIGVWAPEGGSCDLPDVDAGGEFPFLVVTRDGYGSHESDCRLTMLGPAASSGRPLARALAFACAGEGETWAVTERRTLQYAQRRLGGWDLRQAQLIGKGEVFRRCGIDARPIAP